MVDLTGVVDKLSASIVLSRLVWRLLRPVVSAVAKSTRNTSFDDDMVSAIDEIFNAPTSAFDDVVGKERRVRNAVSVESSRSQEQGTIQTAC